MDHHCTGTKRENVWCTAYNTRRLHHEERQGERTKRPPSPSASGEARGACELQGVPVDELQEYLYP